MIQTFNTNHKYFSHARLRFEELEPRLLLAADWQNPGQPLDIDDNARINTADVLIGINRLNDVGAAPLGTRDTDAPFFDATGDGEHTPLDILVVINALNNPESLFVAARLANDTAPHHTRNRDRLTFDATIDVTMALGGAAVIRGSLHDSDPAKFIDLVASPAESITLDHTALESLNGGPLVDGDYYLHLQARRDQLASRVLTYTFTVDRTAPQADVRLATTNRVAFDSFDIDFGEKVILEAFDPAAFNITVVGGVNDGTAVPVTQVNAIENGTVARLQLENRLPDQSYRLAFTQPLFDAAGNEVQGLDTFEFVVADPPSLVSLSPSDGESMVNVSRETIVRFDEAINPATITNDSFHLIANGERLPGNIRVSRTERFATFFHDAPLPASTEVRVVLDGDLIRDKAGIALDGDNDGEPGGNLHAHFRTLPLTPIPGTNVFGFVRDSLTEQPIEGATIRLESLPGISATTNAIGRFELMDVPAPEFFVVIDGSTAVNPPPGMVYPTLGKPFHSVPGQTVQLEMGHVPFDIFLPPMSPGDVQPLSSAETTEIGFGAAAKTELAAMFPDVDSEVWNRLQVTFPPSSAQNAAGEAANEALLIPVPPDRLPAPLPPNVDPRLVISVQAGINGNFNAAGGATNFDVPAPITLPNLEGLAPGEKSLIWSFDHDAGKWIVNGTGTVSEDGRVIVSDEGVGIQAPGWHFGSPGVVTDIDLWDPSCSFQLSSCVSSEIPSIELIHLGPQGTNITGGHGLRPETRPAIRDFLAGVISGVNNLRVDFDDFVGRKQEFVRDTMRNAVSQTVFSIENTIPDLRNVSQELADNYIQSQQVVSDYLNELAAGIDQEFAEYVADNQRVSDFLSDGIDGIHQSDAYDNLSPTEKLAVDSAMAAPQALWETLRFSGETSVATILSIETGLLRLGAVSADVNAYEVAKGGIPGIPANYARDVTDWVFSDPQGQAAAGNLIITTVDKLTGEFISSDANKLKVLNDVKEVGNKLAEVLDPATANRNKAWGELLVRLERTGHDIANGGNFLPRDYEELTKESRDLLKNVNRVKKVGDIANALAEFHDKFKSRTGSFDDPSIQPSEPMPVENPNAPLTTGLTVGKVAADAIEAVVRLQKSVRILRDQPTLPTAVQEQGLRQQFDALSAAIDATSAAEAAAAAAVKEMTDLATNFMDAVPTTFDSLGSPFSPIRIIDDSGTGFIQNVSTNATGTATVTLPPNGRFVAEAVSRSGRAGVRVRFNTRESGENVSLRPLFMPIPPTADDQDNDGLKDVAERVFGTSSENADTDNDGISDLAEVEQGLDPLSGLAFPTGVIASLPLRGQAREVVVAGTENGQLAYVATGTHGLAIVDAGQFNNPIVLGQLALPGENIDVTVDPLLGLAAVAGRHGGLHIIDIRDPMLPELLQTIEVGADQITAADGILYVTTGKMVRGYDLLSLTPLFVRSLEGQTGQDIAIDGEHLYVLTNQGLQVYRRVGFDVVSAGRVDVEGSTAPLEIGRRLFVADGLAYVGYFRGYSVIDVTNPNAPVIIGEPPDTQAAIHDFAANGSGLLLPITSFAGRQSLRLSLYDANDPTDVTGFITSLDTPGDARAVAVASGIAYVADDAGGLAVVNYLPFDNQGVAPTASFTTDVIGGQVEEGSRVGVRVNVTDDVQVRKVNVLLDGQIVTSDVTYPFALDFSAPLLATQDQFDLTVQAVDTGGNTATTPAQSFTVIADSTAPALLATTPDGNSIIRAVQSISLFFDESVSLNGTVDDLALVELGTDGRPGGGDDVTIPVADITRFNARRLVVTTENALPFGHYELRIPADAIGDLADNLLDDDLVIGFRSFDVASNELRWGSDADGDWSDPTNWNQGRIPSADDDVFINRLGADPTITISDGQFSVGSLLSEGNLSILGGELSISGLATVNGDLTIDQGSITARGEQAVLTATGAVTFKSATLRALAGGELRLPNATSFAHTTANSFSDVTLSAEGAGSVLDLSGVTAITGSDRDNSDVFIRALDGGRIDLSSVSEITVLEPNFLAHDSGLDITADGTDSLVDLSSLMDFVNHDLDPAESLIDATNGGHIFTPNLQRIHGVTLRRRADGTVDTSSLTTVTSSTLSVFGTTPDFTTVTDVSSSSLFVQDGGTLRLPSVTRFDHSPPRFLSDVTLQADGAGSVLDLSGVTAITGSDRDNSDVFIRALAGGRIDLSRVSEITVPEPNFLAHDSGLDITADGTDSEVDLSTLVRFRNADPDSSLLKVAAGGKVTVGSSTALSNVHVQIGDGSELEAGTLTVEGNAIFWGAGTLRGNLTSDATVRPDQGVLTVTGNYRQTARGALEIDLLDPTTGASESLDVQGIAELGGVLSVFLASAYTPSADDQFDILTFSNHSGDFAMFNEPAVPTGLTIHRTFNSVALNVAFLAAQQNAEPANRSSPPTGKQAASAELIDHVFSLWESVPLWETHSLMSG